MQASQCKAMTMIHSSSTTALNDCMFFTWSSICTRHLSGPPPLAVPARKPPHQMQASQWEAMTMMHSSSTTLND